MSNETNRLALDELAAPAMPPGGEDQEGRPAAAAERLPAEVHPPAAGRSDDLGAVFDIPVQLSAVLGKTTMPVSQLLRLGRGAVVELDRKVGESIDILVNNRLVARGEVVILDDRLGVTMTEIIKTDM
jgi:flagellar motor switch protein FliN/FliY